MTAHLEIGDERYTVEQGTFTPEAADDVLHRADAQYFTTVASVWLEQAQRDGSMGTYVPDMDCALATVIARKRHGRVTCEPMPRPPSGTTF